MLSKEEIKEPSDSSFVNLANNNKFLSLSRDLITFSNCLLFDYNSIKQDLSNDNDPNIYFAIFDTVLTYITKYMIILYNIAEDNDIQLGYFIENIDGKNYIKQNDNI